MRKERYLFLLAFLMLVLFFLGPIKFISALESYTITYYDGTEQITSLEEYKTYTSGTEFTLPNYQKNGYHFLGWTLTNSDTDTTYQTVLKDTTTGNQTFYAKFEGSFETNGAYYGSLADAVNAVSDNGTITLRDDYTLLESLTIAKPFCFDLNEHSIKTKLTNPITIQVPAANCFYIQNGSFYQSRLVDGDTSFIENKAGKLEVKDVNFFLTTTSDCFGDATVLLNNGDLKIQNVKFNASVRNSNFIGVMNYGTLTVESLEAKMLEGHEITIVNNQKGASATILSGVMNGFLTGEGNYSIKGGSYKSSFSDKWLATGYTLVETDNEEMPFEVSSVAGYTVKHYFENVDGTYQLLDTYTQNVLGGVGQNVIATPITSLEHYKYDAQASISSGIVLEDGSLVLKMYYQLERFTVYVTVNDSMLGSVNIDKIDNVPYGSPVEKDGNNLIIQGISITPIPLTNASQVAEFLAWDTIPTEITSNIELHAKFTKTAVFYQVEVRIRGNYGTVSKSLVESVPYGTSLKSIDNQLQIGEEVITATAFEGTKEYQYSFTGFSYSGDSVKSNMIIYALFEKTPQTYKVSIVMNNPSYGQFEGEITNLDKVPYNTVINVKNNSITINNETITAVANNPDEKYTYSFDHYEMTSSQVTEDITITAYFVCNEKTYSVIMDVNDASYGLIEGNQDLLQNIAYGTVISVSKNVITINGITFTALAATPTQEYLYTFDHFEGVVDKVTNNVAIVAVFTRTIQNYAITIQINDASYGSIQEGIYQISDVPYGTVLSVLNNTLSINDMVFTAIETPRTDLYTYVFDSFTMESDTVCGNMTVTVNFSAIFHGITITWMNGETVIQETHIAQDEVPVYSGDVPTKKGTQDYEYRFIGWSPEITNVSVDTTYTAVFEMVLLKLESNNSLGEVILSTGFPFNASLTISKLETTNFNIPRNQAVVEVYQVKLVTEEPIEGVYSVRLKKPEGLSGREKLSVIVLENGSLVTKEVTFEGDYIQFSTSSLGQIVLMREVKKNNSLTWLYVCLGISGGAGIIAGGMILGYSIYKRKKEQ